MGYHGLCKHVNFSCTLSRTARNQLQNDFCRKFHRFHLQRRAGDRRRGGAGRHLFDLLSLSSEGHPCGDPALWNTAGRLLKLRFNFVTYGLGTVSIFFVTSSTSNFIRTEQGLHYKNIFVGNGFGCYLRVRREVIFSPVMGDWLIHRDISSVEYNGGSPTKISPMKSRSFLFWVCSQ